jgi:hypothetical protein
LIRRPDVLFLIVSCVIAGFVGAGISRWLWEQGY